MKKNPLVILSVMMSCFYFIPVNAQTDSAALLKNRDSIIKSQSAKLDSISKAKVGATDQESSTVCRSCCGKAELGWKQWLLVFLPTLFVIFLGSYLMKWIKKEKFKLSEALSGASVTMMKPVSRPDRKNPSNNITTNEPVTEPVPSMSRFIAFITGVAAVIIAVCLVTYYAYFAIAECNTPVNYEQLWKILAGLGIGVIPYGINVWNKNTKENPPQPES
jgi:hypothetical protein